MTGTVVALVGNRVLGILMFKSCSFELALASPVVPLSRLAPGTLVWVDVPSSLSSSALPVYAPEARANATGNASRYAAAPSTLAALAGELFCQPNFQFVIDPRVVTTGRGILATLVRIHRAAPRMDSLPVDGYAVTGSLYEWYFTLLFWQGSRTFLAEATLVGNPEGATCCLWWLYFYRCSRHLVCAKQMHEV
jgi:hypothetical protein